MCGEFCCVSAQSTMTAAVRVKSASRSAQSAAGSAQSAAVRVASAAASAQIAAVLQVLRRDLPRVPLCVSRVLRGLPRVPGVSLCVLQVLRVLLRVPMCVYVLRGVPRVPLSMAYFLSFSHESNKQWCSALFAALQ